MGYSKGCHTTFHHRSHIVWAPKYRYKVLIGDVRLRVREIIKQVCDEMGVTIINGALSRDQVHMFVEILPPIADRLYPAIRLFIHSAPPGIHRGVSMSHPAPSARRPR